MDVELNPSLTCEELALSAYVEGELDEHANSAIESHLQSCAGCRDTLRAHQSFLCELDSAFMTPLDVPVPQNFSRIVTARATSDMSSVRSSGEYRKAIAISLSLALIGFPLLGSVARHWLWGSVRRIIGSVSLLADLAWSTAYGATAGALVISRAVARRLVVESGGLVLLLLLLTCAIIVLSRLITNYHRAHASD
jgi:anti-sigma factor RsiW